MLLGELQHINKPRFWPLEAVLHDRYLFPKDEADAISAFLALMLNLHPKPHAKACDFVHQPIRIVLRVSAETTSDTSSKGK